MKEQKLNRRGVKSVGAYLLSPGSMVTAIAPASATGYLSNLFLASHSFVTFLSMAARRDDAHSGEQATSKRTRNPLCPTRRWDLATLVLRTSVAEHRMQPGQDRPMLTPMTKLTIALSSIYLAAHFAYWASLGFRIVR